ncbi:hypothetical protein [Siphonobacter aquaeclarae]|jgi:hypothetical protein|uniref:Uncharacterized protein n=1 Tax=Siphonobacter aquaeclarae TaxID=563176 RepID=A0A1G9PZ83_9BACT|nr:hypothetical protein [Siphonobacter aquaeclarae]MBO9638023.1 hypothetical protein [Siphonobacter aquaeclarae]SDM04039.1 hypothetical protein SAMN04488090_2391 [Siphonobacter aquaeclarae]
MVTSRTLSNILTSSGFLAVIVCFFFNFLTISCSEQPVATVTGWTLVTGGKPDPVIPEWSKGLKNEDIAEFGQNGNAALTQSRRIPMQPAAAIPLLAAALGIIAVWGPRRLAACTCGVLAMSGLASLLYLRYTLSDFDRLIRTANSDLTPLSPEDLRFIRLFSVDWGGSFWAAVFLFGCILVYCIFNTLRKRTRA